MCKCGKPSAPSKRYCAECHAAYMREWRKSHPLTEEQLKKATARRIASVYQSRGKLSPLPCEVCGSQRTEKHHDDYSQPLNVRWLCRPHHLDLHRAR